MEEYLHYLNQIWESHQLTNHSPLVVELERKLKEYLGVRHLFFVSKGTIALQIAIRALGLRGEVITTPFSYVATTSSIVWEGCTPVFADIHPRTLCIDPQLVEESITPQTTAILATHVYGIPCDVAELQRIAMKHNLKLIYDAAHTFGARYKGCSLASYGDVSTLSFHATKIFHTAEGGAIITNNDQVAHQISYMRNFGHKGQEDFWGLGINGKNSEFHAAMGLCILPHLAECIAARKQVCGWYDERLAGSALTRPLIPEGSEYNYAYYPVLFPTEKSLLRVREALNGRQIFPRRYFYPSLTSLPYVSTKRCPRSEEISPRILCLPLYKGLSENEVGLITETILASL